MSVPVLVTGSERLLSSLLAKGHHFPGSSLFILQAVNVKSSPAAT
jgi:hypothetical protein